MAPSLIGPPSLSATPSPKPHRPSGDPFVDLMVSDFNNLAQNPNPNYPPMILTENGSATFASTGNPCLDFFFHVVPTTTAPSYLHSQLPLAWAHNPLTTLKLICNLRGVRGTGKSDKDNFYTAAMWLHKHHPKTLACNVGPIADFGYFKDLPEMLYRLLEGDDVRQKQKSEWMIRKSGGAKSSRRPPVVYRGGARRGRGRRAGNNYKNTPAVSAKNKKARHQKEAAGVSEKEKASALRKEKFAAMAKKALERYQRDPDYRFLHERVSDHFAECLKRDLASLKASESKNISLAAKWCPSLDSSFDRATLLCESIARKVFDRESYPEYEGVEEAHYAYRVRDRLRKEVLVPLRIVLELPEVYMGANLWGAIPYNRVASVAMKLYKDKFLKHDEERFKKYLEDVKAGKSTIAAGALLPHKIIASLDDGDDGGEVAELQWKRVVEDLLKEGKMRNCLAVCDVSGSMSGEPMDVCVALGMLVAELNEEPWKGKVITFSANPMLHLIEGDDLRSKSEFVKGMEWGGNTDLQKVFDLILEVAVKGKLKPEQMIKRVFVFSDMEFDQASGYYGGHGGYYGGDYGGYRGYGSYGGNQVPRGWETDYQVIQRKYREKGYGDAVPQIVFWNLRDSKATPVPGTQPGVALLSGFSKNLLKLFLDNDGEIRPDATMELAISGPEYQKLVVLD